MNTVPPYEAPKEVPIVVHPDQIIPLPIEKKKRGRPKGSKNKPKCEEDCCHGM